MSATVGEVRRQELFGLEFIDAESPAAVADVLVSQPRSAYVSPGRLPVVITPNVDFLVQFDRGLHPDADAVMRRAGVVLPDGQPIVWASRWLRRPLRARLPGSELVAAMWPRLVGDGRPVMVVAPSERVAGEIRAEAPDAVVMVAPMLDVQRADEMSDFTRQCIAAAAGANVSFVFVAIGFPKSCNVVHGMVTSWPDSVEMPLLLTVGASFEMYYRHVRRAPTWVQRLGLEWAFRLVQEPRRLFRRYLIDDPYFVKLLLRERRALRRAGREAAT